MNAPPALSVTIVTTADEVKLLRRAWTDEDGEPVVDPGFTDRFAQWFAEGASSRTFWIARVGDEAVGMINLVHVAQMPRPGAAPGAWGYVGNVYVLPECRDRGVGRALLDAAIAEARARGYKRLVLHPTQRSVPLYRRVGFDDADILLVHPLT